MFKTEPHRTQFVALAPSGGLPPANRGALRRSKSLTALLDGDDALNSRHAFGHKGCDAQSRLPVPDGLYLTFEARGSLLWAKKRDVQSMPSLLAETLKRPKDDGAYDYFEPIRVDVDAPILQLVLLFCRNKSLPKGIEPPTLALLENTSRRLAMPWLIREVRHFYPLRQAIRCAKDYGSQMAAREELLREFWIWGSAPERAPLLPRLRETYHAEYDDPNWIARSAVIEKWGRSDEAPFYLSALLRYNDIITPFDTSKPSYTLQALNLLVEAVAEGRAAAFRPYLQPLNEKDENNDLLKLGRHITELQIVTEIKHLQYGLKRTEDRVNFARRLVPMYEGHHARVLLDMYRLFFLEADTYDPRDETFINAYLGDLDSERTMHMSYFVTRRLISINMEDFLFHQRPHHPIKSLPQFLSAALSAATFIQEDYLKKKKATPLQMIDLFRRNYVFWSPPYVVSDDELLALSYNLLHHCRQKIGQEPSGAHFFEALTITKRAVIDSEFNNGKPIHGF